MARETPTQRKARRTARKPQVTKLLGELDTALADDAPTATERRGPDIAKLLWTHLRKTTG